MIFKKVLLLLILISCTPQLNNIKNYKPVKNSFHATGFAYIFDEKDFKNSITSKKFDNSKLIASHPELRPGTMVKITNPENNSSVLLKIKSKSNYPDFYKILITNAVANKINLNSELPFIEVQEIKKNKSFIATKAKIFEEEKKVSNKAPVVNVKISNLSTHVKSKKKKNKKFSIQIAEFYSNKSAVNLKNKLKEELSSKKIFVKKSGKNNYKLISGPYKTINLLKNDYIDLKKYGFEDLDIKLND